MHTLGRLLDQFGVRHHTHTDGVCVDDSIKSKSQKETHHNRQQTNVLQKKCFVKLQTRGPTLTVHALFGWWWGTKKSTSDLHDGR